MKIYPFARRMLSTCPEQWIELVTRIAEGEEER